MTDPHSFVRKYDLTKQDDSDSEDDEPEFKKFRCASSKGSSLKSLLPPPKRKTTAKTTSFLPDVLKKKTTTIVNKQPIVTPSLTKPANTKKLIDYDDEDEDDEPIDFFSFDQDKKDSDEFGPQIQPVQPVQSNKFETDLIKNNSNNLSIASSIKSSNEKTATYPTSVATSDPTTSTETTYQKDRRLKYEIERKFGEEVGDDVRIQEVNIANHLNENLDYLKTLTEEKDVDVKGPAPSSLAKRKHQITYLAYQAKQNELKLKKEWAQGRINRELSRSKYGF